MGGPLDTSCPLYKQLIFWENVRVAQREKGEREAEAEREKREEREREKERKGEIGEEKEHTHVWG